MKMAAFQQQLDEEDLRRMAEDEYNKLKSKFHFFESGKPNNQVNAVLMQQEKLLNILHEQKRELKTNINVTTSKIYRGVEDQGLTNVYNCIEKEKKLDDEIVNEKSQIKDLKTEIENVKKEIIDSNRTDINESKITDSILKAEKRVANLEDKLQVATTKFNDMLTLNACYRREIENLLNERKNFFKFYMRIYNQLIRGKQIMLDLVEQATTTYDQREEAFTKLKNLKEKTAAEKRIQSKDVQELKRKLENCEQLYEFLSVKGQKRILADLEAREAREKKRLREEIEEKIRNYVSLLDKIKNLSDEKNIDKFVARFKKNEAENIGLFNYVNEVNDEVDFLQNQVTSLLDRIDEQRALNEKRTREQEELIHDLQESLTAIEEAYADSSAKLEASEILLNGLLFNIEKMFQEFECDSKPILQLLGNNAHVNIFNASVCLQLLETQLYEFIYITYAKERYTMPEELASGSIVQEDYHMVASKRPLIYHLAPSSPCPLCVETDRIFVLDENNESDTLEEYEDVHRQLLVKIKGSDMNNLLHNISTCRLPRSRAIMQARFQEQEHEKLEAASRK